MRQESGQIERQNRRGRTINLLLNVIVLLLLGVGTYLMVKFGMQLLGQHLRF